MDKVELIDLVIDLVQLNKHTLRQWIGTGMAPAGAHQAMIKYDAILTKMRELKDNG